MARHALLEINVSRRDETGCLVDLRYERPDDSLLGDRVSGEIALDLQNLFAHRHDRAAYGKVLIGTLLASVTIGPKLCDVVRDALHHYDALRIRLHVADASPLHSVRWETLSDPEDSQRWLLTNERILFSRFLSPQRRPAIPLRGPDTMRVLVVVANPPELGAAVYRSGSRILDPIDVAGEIARIRAALAPVVPEVLTTSDASPHATTVRNLSAKLAEDFDVLYLVCHGAMTKDSSEAVLYLGSDQVGRPPAVLGTQFVSALEDLPVLPRLIVLASCQSAGSGDLPRTSDSEGVLASLAPMLARIGVPAVLAMQGSVTITTIATFMPRFFAELRKDGQIDRAVAAARAAVGDQRDSWMPTLYLQTPDGRLWAPPGAVATLTGFNKWAQLLEGINAGDCAAVLGSGLFDASVVPLSGIARRLARKEGLPFVEHGRDDMPHVAQYLATMNEPATLRRRWMEAIKGDLGPAATTHGGGAGLDTLVSTVGRQRRQPVGNTPHQILAKLPFRIYIVTTPDNLMADALAEAGREPVVEIFRWHVSLEGLPTVYDTDQQYRPTKDRPLVYHLLGHLKYPKSLVLTEDDYLEYLTRIRSREVADSAMTSVEAALKSQPLVLLGFQHDDWDFRVLFRSIAAGDRSRPSANQAPSVAVQLMPDEKYLQPKQVQAYLEKYLGLAKVDVSWGTPEMFLTELWRQWRVLKGARDE